MPMEAHARDTVGAGPVVVLSAAAASTLAGSMMVAERAQKSPVGTGLFIRMVGLIISA
ncbi:hypothetical protein O4H66_06455 [Comamonadaceae bacterium G21597-S1]|nr:hypothetical protein [Comamonadaceae bacterium G21597-S1]